jgi:hypothetical protein
LKKIIIILIFIFSINNLFSQAGSQFYEFAEKLEQYFDKSLITDVKNALPQGSDYLIWGWDVGDFSGDKINDLAFGIVIKGEKKKKVRVYQFVDIDGFLTKVNEIQYDFFELPLEVGLVIKKNVCYITQKSKQFNWKIFGFTYDNGVIMKLDEYETEKFNKITKETYTNFVNLKCYEKYINTGDGKELFNTDYLTIPSYPRGKKIYKGYASESYSDYTDYASSGAFHWNGEKDLSYSVRSSYDEQFLYFLINVNDESVIPYICDTCNTDAVTLWLDMNQLLEDGIPNSKVENEKLLIKDKAETGIYKFVVRPGDFKEIKPYLEINTTDKLENFQKLASQSIKVSSNYTKTGYVVKFKIPFQIFGVETNFLEETKINYIGCTISVNDIDNEFRLDEKTILSTSKFIENNPSTFGKLIIVPQNQWFGDSKNIFKDDILKAISDNGF